MEEATVSSPLGISCSYPGFDLALAHLGNEPMPWAYHPHLDVTRQIDLADPQAVAAAIFTILNQRYGRSWPRELLVLAFDWIKSAYQGGQTGLLACDTPYHDYCHTLDVALTMVRMIDGHEAALGKAQPLGGTLAAIGVLLALFHDVGYLRRTEENHLCGAQLVVYHELRSAELAERLLDRTEYSAYAPLSRLILATSFRQPLDELFAEFSPDAADLGRMLASADILCQVADRCYLERCRDFLYREFVDGGLDRIVGSDGSERILYETPEDLLRKTPGFFEAVVIKRLEKDLGGHYHSLDWHFSGENPYRSSMHANIDFLKRLVAENDFSHLRRQPRPLCLAS